MNNLAAARFAGIACLFGGLLFFLDFAVIGWVVRANFYLSHENQAVNLMRAILWIVSAIGLTGGSLGLIALGATGAGWRKNLGFCGGFFNLLGAASYIVGTVFIYSFPDRSTKQFFTPLGSILLTIGMLQISAAVLAAGKTQGWKKFIPLLVGLYFPVQLPLQIIFFLGQGRGPNPMLLGAWGLVWMLLGYVVWSSAGSQTINHKVLVWQE